MKMSVGGQFLKEIITNSNLTDQERCLSILFTMVR